MFSLRLSRFLAKGILAFLLLVYSLPLGLLHLTLRSTSSVATSAALAYPCQFHDCGCQSYQQCMSQCCCYPEHLAWRQALERYLEEEGQSLSPSHCVPEEEAEGEGLSSQLSWNTLPCHSSPVQVPPLALPSLFSLKLHTSLFLPHLWLTNVPFEMSLPLEPELPLEAPPPKTEFS